MGSASMTEPAPLSQFERLPRETRHAIYSYIGFPVGRHIWTQCELSIPPKTARKRGQKKQKPSPPTHPVPHIEGRCQPAPGPQGQQCGPVERKTRLMSIILDSDKSCSRRRKGKMNPLVLECLLEGHSCPIELSFEKSLLKVNKGLREELLSLFHTDICVIFDRGYQPSRRLRPLGVPNPLHHLTAITLTCGAEVPSGSPQFRIFEDICSIKHLAKQAYALEHLTYSPATWDILNCPKSQLTDLSAAFADLAEQRMSTLKDLTIRSRYVQQKIEESHGVPHRTREIASQGKPWFFTKKTHAKGWSISLSAIDGREVNSTLVVHKIMKERKAEIASDWCESMLEHMRFHNGLLTFTRAGRTAGIRIEWDDGNLMRATARGIIE